MSDVFFKPGLGNASAAPVHFPYTREKLLERPIFPAYVFDGGAFFFATDVFGTADGDRILEMTMSGDLFRYWQFDGRFDWDAVWKQFHGLHYTAEWEGHIWLNRLYILLPLAQAFCRTGERRYAEKWYDLLCDWYRCNPYTTYDDRADDLVWRDMQVAWRTINLVHSVFLMGERDPFTHAQWETVYGIIRVHAAHMLKEGRYRAAQHKPGNHYLQIGMALIMTGILFPELGDTDDCLCIGRIIVEDNLKYSIFDDGVNEEDSLSYCHFIARLYLEAELLLTKNGLPGIAGCAEKLQRQYEFMYQFASPDGKTLQIGDSYALDAFTDIDYVNSIYPLTFDRTRRSMLFPQSRMAVLHCGAYSVYVDAMDMREWHQHYGRPHFLAFAGDQQLVADSGCVNYDRYDLRVELNGPFGHNVITCDELPLEKDLEKTDVTEELAVEAYRADDAESVLTVRNRVSAPDGRFYVWRRTFRLTPGGLTVTDRVEASQVMHFQSLLHLPSCRVGYYDPAVTVGKAFENRAVQPVSRDCRTVSQRRGSRLAVITAQTPFESTFRPAMAPDNRYNYVQLLTRCFETDSFEETTVISLK